MRHPGKVERTEIWTALNTARIDFLLEFAKRPQASIDCVPAEASDEANQACLEHRQSDQHFTFDDAARLHRFGHCDEDQPWPAVDLPRLRADTNRFAAIRAIAMSGFASLQSIEPGERKILVTGDQFAEVSHAVINALMRLAFQHAERNLRQIDG